MIDTTQNFEDLCNAVIVQALQDYKRAMATNNRIRKEEVVRFFKSGDCSIYTNIPPEVFLDKIKDMERGVENGKYVKQRYTANKYKEK